MVSTAPRLLTSRSVGYDGGPHYAWDSTLTFDKLAGHLAIVNQKEAGQYQDNLQLYELDITGLRWSWQTPTEPGDREQ